MIGRSGRASLRQFLEFEPEDVIHSQGLRDFAGNVAKFGSAGVDVRFLQEDQIGARVPKEIDNPTQLKAAIDIPADNLDGLGPHSRDWRIQK